MHDGALVSESIPRRNNRRPKRGERGFKILEAIISMAVLAIAAAGILQLHTTVVSGIRSSESISTAIDIAKSRADDVYGRDIATLPLSTCVYTSAQTGCALDNGRDFSGALTPPCTDEVNGSDIAETDMLPDVDPTARYRVDTTFTNHVATPIEGDELLLVSVCWREGARVKQVQIRKVLISTGG